MIQGMLNDRNNMFLYMYYALLFLGSSNTFVGVWMFVTVKSLLLFGLNFKVPSNHQDCIYKLHKTPIFFAVGISPEPYFCQKLDVEFKVL